jgi:His/Glu/Gln/Arg/opine family amino acid ABC transporter permease subunit
MLDLNVILQSLPDLFEGLKITLKLTILTLILGACLALPVGVIRAGDGWASKLLWGYTYFFRGTPMLVQLFLIYYGLAQFKEIRSSGLWPLLREGWWCCLIAFTLNTAAYTAEVVAGALRNVRHEDVEAGRAFGMTRFQLLTRIRLPMALRLLWPAYTNEAVFVLHSTALASLVTVLDLTGAARIIIARTFAPYELFLTIALVYLGLTWALLSGFRRVEHSLFRHHRTASHLPEIALR